MKHSSKKTAQLIAARLQQVGISDIIISPGSRNAPLIIEFTNQDFFKNLSIIDERSAGFFALGMAQQTGKPVVLNCSSGSALLNYHPAVSEAFYSKIPLIIISADRPQKWVDQGEGQTIRQDNALKNHSYYNTTLNIGNSKTSVADNDKKIALALKTAIEKQGPVHINVPFDEPLYETVSHTNINTSQIAIDSSDPVCNEILVEKLANKWLATKKKMILVGQYHISDSLQQQLIKLSQDPSVIVLNENISNVQDELFINNIDQTIFSLPDSALKELQPEILITIGRNLISKKIKQFLRKHPPKEHWHIEKSDSAPDTFMVLKKHINTGAEMFLSQFIFKIYDKIDKTKSNYQQNWLEIKYRNKILHKKYLEQISFSDLKIFEIIARSTPKNYMIQWGNSSTIRYAQLFDYKPGISHFSNRGTSGIDGSVSTAVGATYALNKNSLLVIGDISFLYDSNGLWNNYISKKLKIIVINNGGGDIFNFIPGPSKTKAINQYFVTKHEYHMSDLAKMYNLRYRYANNLTQAKIEINDMFSSENQAQLLEIDTSEIKNHQVLQKYFEQFR